MLVPNRHGSSNSYRYGFQGQEKDDELKGEGNSLNYTYRMHDPRVGRFFATDPMESVFTWNSPYAFSENDVISHVELEGLEKGKPKTHSNINAIQSIDNKMIESLVDMSKSKKVSTNSLGWPRDPQYFWKQYSQSELGKESLSKANLERINGKTFRSPVVDEEWNSAMKKYDLDGKLGEGIEHHHHNKGATAYPRPKSKHTGEAWNKVLHNLHKRFGKVRQNPGYFTSLQKMKGKLPGLFNLINVAGLISDSPHSPLYQFGNGSEKNRAYYDSGSGLYYEIKKENDKGDMFLQFFMDYERIDGEWRGTGKIENGHWYYIQEDGSYSRIKPVVDSSFRS
jgi:RHS repeat-associated protein